MTILVTGATGTIGSRLVRALAARGHETRAMVHRTAAEPPPLPEGVRGVVADYGDPASLDAALRGVQRLFLVCPNGPDQVAHELGLIDAAVRAGVERIVKVSARGADPASPVAFWQWHAAIENHLWASGIPSVALRPGFSMANVLGHADDARTQGIVVAPEANAPIAMIDPDDVAHVAADLLTRDTLVDERGILELTGPETVTFADIAAELTSLTGRPIAYVSVTDAQTRDYLGGRGVPPFVIEQILAVFAHLRAGGQASITPAVTNLLGRPARTLREFLNAHAKAFTTVPEPTVPEPTLESAR